MKSLMKDLIAAVLMGMVLPGFLLNATILFINRGAEISAIQVSIPQVTESGKAELTMRLRDNAGSVIEMNMDQYLVGVVLAEMPASFEIEALKAQAVAARTYTQKACVSGGKHGDGSVCTQPACCQAYITETAYLSQGGTVENLDKIRGAVEGTSGYVLTYEGELIEATYFSCSGGSTEDAAAVWGTEFPYLQAVNSPGEENAKFDTNTVVFTPEEFCNALNIQPTGTPDSWLGAVTYTRGGGVDTMIIAGESFTGLKLRSLLNLRSTVITVAADEDYLTITTRGYGHRVGMSQYGADAMAASGSSYEEILSHYYPGTSLIRWDAAQNGEMGCASGSA